MNLNNKLGRIASVTGAYVSTIGTDFISSLGQSGLPYSSSKMTIFNYITIGVIAYGIGTGFDKLNTKLEERKNE